MRLSTIYILYNAKASVIGKLDYARRKLSASVDSSPCHACDLTHGGLRLTETAAWKDTKRRINANVVQLHQDELSPMLADFVKAENISYPTVLAHAPGGNLKLLLDADSLKVVSKDHEAFLALLEKRASEESIPFIVDSAPTSSATL